MANVTDETEVISDVDMTETRDIPDHPWPYMRDVRHCLRQKEFMVNALHVYSP